MEPNPGRGCKRGMKRTCALALTTALLLLLAAPAVAKELTAARVCGADGCTTVRDRSVVAALPEGGDPTDPPTRAAPFYRMTMFLEHQGTRERYTVAVVPSLGLMRGPDGTWMPMSGALARLFGQIARRHEPFAAAGLKGVGRAVKPAPPASGGLGWPAIAALAAAALAVLAGAALTGRRALARRRPDGTPPGPARAEG